MPFAGSQYRLAGVYAFLYSVELLAPIFIRTHADHFLRKSSAWREIESFLFFGVGQGRELNRRDQPFQGYDQRG